MRLRLTGLIVVVVTFLSIVATSTISGQQRRGRTNPPPSASPADLTITYRTTMSGRAFESSTMIKGKRERSEMRTGYGMDTINLTQCDLKRTIQISDKTKKYTITPMEVGNSSTQSSSDRPVTTAEPSRRGGTINYVTTITDTGERKEMFGFTARHVKSSLSMESSADACTPLNQRMETDGWYIDLTFGLDCDLDVAQMANRPAVPRGGCRDRVVWKQLGSGRKGYPLIETTTMYGIDGSVMFSSTKEVLELSREPLEAALFEIPAGYTEATSAQELYGAPSMASIMAQASQANQSETSLGEIGASAVNAKKPGALRVGVVAINNRTDRPVSLETLRQRLIRGIETGNVEAIALNAISPAEIEAEAKAKSCDFILYTDISSLKISAAKKLGGLLGRAAGVSGIEKTEARVDFKLFAVGESSPRLQSSATGKEEGDEASAGASLDGEASKVSAEVRKKARG